MAPALILHTTVISDTICPWCFLGKRRLARAVAEVSREVGDTVAFPPARWRPWLLTPRLTPAGRPKRDAYLRKFRGSAAAVAQMEATMGAAFAKEGAQFNLEGNMGSTVMSHALLALAGHADADDDAAGNGEDAASDRQGAAAEALFAAYFARGANLADHSVLLEVAAAVLPEGRLREFRTILGYSEMGEDARALESESEGGSGKSAASIPKTAVTAAFEAARRDVLREVRETAEKHGVSGVPHFILSVGLAGCSADTPPLLSFPLPGAQDEATFVAVLRKLIAKAIDTADPMGLSAVRTAVAKL